METIRMNMTRWAAFALGGMAWSAQAQNLTIYGQVDAGVQYEKGIAAHTARLVAGGRSASRLGFRGTEDLGGGMAALFVLEQGINTDTGMPAQGGRAFGRQSFAGLGGKRGTLAAGRIATFGSGTGSFDLFGAVDPFSTAWGIAGVGSTMSTAAGLRVDNALLYQTPDLGGCQAGVLHSLQALNNETSPRGANIYLTGLGAKYAAGPLYVAASYEAANNSAAGRPDEKHLQVGASYDFKFIRLHAAYAREQGLFSTDLNISGTTNGAGAKAYMAGVSVPVGNGTVLASYQKRDGDRLGGENRDFRVLALGHEYFLSKRTSLYAVVADSEGRDTLATSAAYNRRTYTMGVLHKF